MNGKRPLSKSNHKKVGAHLCLDFNPSTPSPINTPSLELPLS